MTKITNKNIRYPVMALMLAVMLVLPNSTTLFAVSMPSQRVYPELPEHAIKLQQKIDEQTDLHPDWVGMLSWNSTGATIEYLGPSSANPFKAKTQVEDRHLGSSNPHLGSGSPKIGSAPVGTLAITTPVNERDTILKDTTSATTAVWKEVANFNIKGSTVNGVNNYQWLDAMTSNNVHWLQVTPVYDKAGFFGTPAWHVDYDAWTVSFCSEDSFFPVISGSIGFVEGDTVESFIRADSVTAGKYVLSVTDLSRVAGHSFTYTITGDSGHNINLGRQFNSASNCVFPSGAQVEEQSSNGSAFNFLTEVFTFKFYDTPTSSATTSVTGFYGPEGNGASVTTQNNPAKATFTYTG